MQYVLVYLKCQCGRHRRHVLVAQTPAIQPATLEEAYYYGLAVA